MTKACWSVALGAFLAIAVGGCRTDCEDLADVCAACPEAAQRDACEFVVETDDADFCAKELEPYESAGCR
jgi:hypothetical protein